MYSIVNTYRGNPANNGHETFSCSTTGYTTLCGVLVTGRVRISLSRQDGQQVMLRRLHNFPMKDVPPNERVYYINEPVCDELLIGVIERIDISDDYPVSVYLLFRK